MDFHTLVKLLEWTCFGQQCELLCVRGRERRIESERESMLCLMCWERKKVLLWKSCMRWKRLSHPFIVYTSFLSACSISMSVLCYFEEESIYLESTELIRSLFHQFLSLILVKLSNMFRKFIFHTNPHSLVMYGFKHSGFSQSLKNFNFVNKGKNFKIVQSQSSKRWMVNGLYLYSAF